ncbi:MAG: hypothetical protein C0468_03470 [Planctomyces sp.]|nr:hypothetical protein [Planctomyces sp.]
MASALLALGSLAAAPSAALAQQNPVQALNQSLFGLIPDARRSDTVLLPAMSKLEAPPPILGQQSALVIPADAPSFAALSAWAQGQPQREAIDAVMKVTAVDNWRTAFVFALRYGADEVEPERVIDGLYVDLGDPPLLAAARFGYLDRMGTLFDLLHVEVTRLMAQDEPQKAAELVIRSMILARQLLDRAYYPEHELGYRAVLAGLGRLIDVQYLDARSEAPKLTPEFHRETAARLANGGFMAIDRIALPVGELAAARQIVDRAFDSAGRPSRETFAIELSRVAASTRPLRAFSEQAKWQALADAQADRAGTLDKVKGIADDWKLRWAFSARGELPRTDVALESQSLDRARFPIIDAVVPAAEVLFDLRQRVVVELIGARTVFAVGGFFARHRTYPPILDATSPTFIRAIDRDPLDRSANPRPLEYDRGRDGVYVAGAEVQLSPSSALGRFAPKGVADFAAPLVNVGYTLYSAGPDNIRHGGSRATQGQPGVEGDYLIHPPVLSLIRQHLRDSGQLR